MGGAPSFSEKLQRFDLNAWFRVSAAGLVYCIILYTFFGFVFVHRHAGMISMEMEAYISHGMSPLIAPGDPAITDMGCLLGSSVFFGLTLGVMNAVLAMAFSIVPWSRGRFSRHDIMPAVSLAALSIYLCFSTELPIVSIGAGLITLPVFFLSWIYPAKKVPRTKTPFIQWVVFVLLLLTPLLVLHNTTFWQIRDAMLVCPLSSSLSDFYYKHTLLAADVIKPAQFRTQNLVAVSSDMGPIRRRPHGTLWIRTANPCSIKGASMVISSHPMECRTLVVHESSELNHSGRIIAEGSKLFDDNRCMRRGIGLSLKVLPLGVIFLMAWISIGLARLYLRMPVMAVFVILLYLSGVSVPVYHAWSLYCLENHPQEIKTYLSSDSEFKRYQALMSMHEELSNKDLKRLSGDSSARVRLNAIIFAEERRSPLFMEMLFHCVHDPQLNVRTKACHALGQIRGKTARDLLDEVLRADPSWYVRDYAYRAMGRQRPVSMVVREDKRQSGPGP